MIDAPRTGNPFFDAWTQASLQFLGSHRIETGGPLAAALPSGAFGEAITRAEENWSLCQRQASDWIKASSQWFKMERADGIAEETLKRMLDPTRFLFAGTDEINQAIQRLVEGPEFADIGTLERQVLKATREWMALREASAAYRTVTAAAWGRAFGTFSAEMAKDPGAMHQGFRPVLDRWLVVANEELIRTQRTEEFLKAQRALLAAGVAYRLKERELVEVWCETHSIPTRTEVDDLHRTVHALRTQVRTLSRQLAATNAGATASVAPKPKPAPRRRAAAKPS